MLKKIGTVLLSTVLMNTLYAQDDMVLHNKSFIGLELGYATVQGDVGGFLPAYIIRDYQESDIEYGIHIGAQNEEWRATLAFNYFDGQYDDGAKQNYEKGLVSIDYFILPESTVRPYIGVNVGYINYESTNNIDMSGFLYGVQAGLAMNIAESVDIDLMYRYSLSSATQDDRNAALDHIGSIVFGINYLF